MKISTLPLLLSLLAFQAHAADTSAAAALAVVSELGQANGQALACGDMTAAARAKALMLRHSPRTPAYGAAFEEATQQGFLSQVKAQAAACPNAQAIAERMDAVTMRLNETLPATEPR